MFTQTCLRESSSAWYFAQVDKHAATCIIAMNNYNHVVLSNCTCGIIPGYKQNDTTDSTALTSFFYSNYNFKLGKHNRFWICTLFYSFIYGIYYFIYYFYCRLKILLLWAVVVVYHILWVRSVIMWKIFDCNCHK